MSGGACSFDGCGVVFKYDADLAAHARQHVSSLIEFRENARESRRRSSKKWRENGGTEYDHSYRREWRAKNPEKWREQQRRWRQRKQARETPEERTARLETARTARAAYSRGESPTRIPGTGGRPPVSLTAVERFVTSTPAIKRTADVVAAAGISPAGTGVHLAHLAATGRIRKLAYGLYAPPDAGEPLAGRLLTRPQVATLLGIGVSTVKRYGHVGHLEEIRVSQRLIRITGESVIRAARRPATRRRVVRVKEACGGQALPE